MHPVTDWAVKGTADGAEARSMAEVSGFPRSQPIGIYVGVDCTDEYVAAFTAACEPFTVIVWRGP